MHPPDTSSLLLGIHNTSAFIHPYLVSEIHVPERDHPQVYTNIEARKEDKQKEMYQEVDSGQQRSSF